MSVSEDFSTPINLYCNESSDDVVSPDTDISEINSPYLDFVVDDDESFLDSIFDSELDQMLECHSIGGALEVPEDVTWRKDVVNWMLKVHAHYRFRPVTAYLSVNYLDRFLSSHTLPIGKGWPQQLLAVACLSLATKMEETRVPILLDIQILEPRFLFKPCTVQRMELLVMANLKWRLNLVTPFHYLQHFISKLLCLSPRCNDFSVAFRTASDLIIDTCRVTSFLDYTPSSIAAAAVIWASNRTIDDLNLGCFHKKINKEMVKRCYEVIKRNKSQLLQGEVVVVVEATMPQRCLKFCHSHSPNILPTTKF